MPYARPLPSTKSDHKTDHSLQILRQPGFHRAVGKIQRTVDDRVNGPNPNEPLRPGEASGTCSPTHLRSIRRLGNLTFSSRAVADPNAPRREGFLEHFVTELRNQAGGKPTDLEATESPKKKR